MSMYYFKTVYNINDDGSFTLVERSHPYEYDGPVALCKKGRESQQKITDAQIKMMQEQQAKQAIEQAAADRTISQFETQGKPGQLSPAAAAQLGSDMDNINRTYNGMRQTAFANMGARGFGSAPSGFSLAAQNGINLGQAEAGTGAFRNAQANTQALLDRALQARMGLSGQNLSGENNAAVTGMNSALAQSKMGSTLGDIGQGISTAANIAGSAMGMAGAFKPSASVASGLNNLPLTSIGANYMNARPNPFVNLGTYSGG